MQFSHLLAAEPRLIVGLVHSLLPSHISIQRLLIVYEFPLHVLLLLETPRLTKSRKSTSVQLEDRRRSFSIESVYPLLNDLLLFCWWSAWPAETALYVRLDIVNWGESYYKCCWVAKAVTSSQKLISSSMIELVLRTVSCTAPFPRGCFSSKISNQVVLVTSERISCHAHPKMGVVSSQEQTAKREEAEDNGRKTSNN